MEDVGLSRSATTAAPLRSLCQPALIAGALALAGCGSTKTQGPELEMSTVEQEKLHATMVELAAGMQTVNDVLKQSARPSEGQRQRVVRALGEMEAAMLGLKQAGGKDHPVIRKQIETFLAETARARQAVQSEPPSYFLAGSVTRACLHCHSPLCSDGYMCGWPKTKTGERVWKK